MDVLLMKFDPVVKGTSTLDQFTDQIELLSFSHGVAMQITGDISNNERTSGKPNHQDFTITKYLDQSTPLLNEACCKGDTFKSAEVVVGRNDKGKVIQLIKYTLKNVVLSSISIGGGGGDKPVETVTMNYNHITWDFLHQKAEGGESGHVPGKWDLAQNKNA
ncbi:MAG: type secretion system secreted protein Hcp [Blastocatellia bacterium]|jgi:type VI secretion system secreted protein Hcp|nr:type secretion system secreted protein Hcp [Blastocatellia bacterium]